jgi:adenine-specific DNA-methyltransferase
VIAICIDHRELFRLGMLMDEIFHEENRLALINWQKTTPKNQATHVSVTTEYVLVYAKSAAAAKTGETDRSALAEARFHNPDNDVISDWKRGDLTGKGRSKAAHYAVQSPFTGDFCDPGDRHWANKRSQMKTWLEEWNVEYEDFDRKDGRGLALSLKGWGAASTKAKREEVLGKARSAAMKRWKAGNWPYLYWGLDAHQKPVCKQRRALIKQGAVPTSFWVEEDEGPLRLDDVSWLRHMSGRSRDGVEELDHVVGKRHGFDTVKPLKLFKKIIQIWCRPSGIVMDPFAGSGTTAHAVLDLNKETGSSRRFVLIEQGNTVKGDHYAKTLTVDRIRRVITGDWAAGKREPLPGGFRFMELKREKIDADAVNALAREEMIDLLLTSYWDKAERAKSYLRRLPVGTHKYLFAVNPKDEGFFLVWQAAEQPSVLNREVFKEIVAEGQTASLKSRYHVYASIAPYTGAGIEFYKIPDKVLEHIGFNPRSDAFNNEDNAVA